MENIPLSKCTSTGIGEGDERKLVEEFDKVNRVFNTLSIEQQNVIADITKRMAKGMSDFAGRDLAAGTKNRTEFDLYCHYVAGLVGEGLTRQFVACGLEDKSIKNAKGLQCNVFTKNKYYPRLFGRSSRQSILLSCRCMVSIS